MTDIRLQALRIPPGWRIDWNNLYAVEPEGDSFNQGYFEGSTLFSAVNERRRLWLDVCWRPESDPSGEYILRVEYAPWERTEAGRRRKDVPLHFRDGRVVLEYRGRCTAHLVEAIESALQGSRVWGEAS